MSFGVGRAGMPTSSKKTGTYTRKKVSGDSTTYGTFQLPAYRIKRDKETDSVAKRALNFVTNPLRRPSYKKVS